MKKKGTIKAGQNVLVITLSGKQTYVKIYDAAKQLIRHSHTSGAVIKHVAAPGEYLVEANGQIKATDSEQLSFSNPL